MDSRIKTIMEDQTQPYAIAWLSRSRDYGHMNMKIELPAAHEYAWRPTCVIAVTCQIGSTSADADHQKWHKKPYGLKVGLESSNDVSSLEDVEVAVKMLRRIAKGLKSFADLSGEPTTVAELCQRTLMSAKLTWLIVQGSSQLPFNNAGDKSLHRVGELSNAALVEMENALTCAFCPAEELASV